MRRFRVFRRRRNFLLARFGREFSDASRFAFRCVACCSAQRLAWRSGYSADALAIGTARNKTTRQSHPSAHLMGQGRVRGVRGRRRLPIFVNRKNARWSAELSVSKNTPPLCPRFTTMRKTNQKAFDEVRNSHSTLCEFAIRWLTQRNLKRQCFNG